jgi:hypothetical protein
MVLRYTDIDELSSSSSSANEDFDLSEICIGCIVGKVRENNTWSSLIIP